LIKPIIIITKSTNSSKLTLIFFYKSTLVFRLFNLWHKADLLSKVSGCISKIVKIVKISILDFVLVNTKIELISF